MSSIRSDPPAVRPWPNSVEMTYAPRGGAAPTFAICAGVLCTSRQRASYTCAGRRVSSRVAITCASSASTLPSLGAASGDCGRDVGDEDEPLLGQLPPGDGHDAPAVGGELGRALLVLVERAVVAVVLERVELDDQLEVGPAQVGFVAADPVVGQWQREAGFLY